MVALTLAFLPGGPATANHTEDRKRGLEEVGFHDLGGTGFNSAIWGWTRGDNLYATSGTWGTLEVCPSQDDNPTAPTKSGIKIVDATNLKKPEMIARIASIPGAQNNEVRILRVDAGGGAGEFEGKDLLIHTLEPCGAEAAAALVPGFNDVPTEQTGFQLYDVTDPAAPVQLGNHNNGGVGTHNLLPYNRADLQKAFVAAVFNDFPTPIDDLRGEMQIVDITDPNNPALVSTWELIDAQAQGGPTFDELCRPRGAFLASCYLHDVWVSSDGTTAYLSFWDAGLILIDISDPETPTFIGQIQSGGPEAEGNTHAAIPVSRGGKDYVVVGDEDFIGGVAQGSNGYMVQVNAPAALADEIPGLLWVNEAGPDATGVTGDLVYAGTGCTAASYAPIATEIAGNIALVDEFQGTNPVDLCPTYTYAQKVELATQAGAVALIQITDATNPTAAGSAIGTTIPAIEIANAEGVALRDAAETVNSTVRQGLPADLPIDPWGFMRVFDVTSADPADWRQVAEFRGPHTTDTAAGPQNVFSAHNPLPGPDGRVYFSWYTSGVRVFDIGAGGDPDEVAHFVPLPSDHPGDNDTDPNGIQEDNVGFWGSFPIRHPNGELLVLNSDLNRGLYILEAGGAVRGCPSRGGALVVGSEGKDLLIGSAGADTLCGLSGNDVLRGKGGNDHLRGGRGNDKLFGGGGNDRLNAAGGKDVLNGGKGSDRCRGGPGVDREQNCEGKT